MLVPCKDGEAYLAAALESLCAQTLPSSEFEVVFVDDGSRDGSAALARTFAERLTLNHLTHAACKGLGVTCNDALAAAAAPLVIRVDADDLADPRLLELMLCEADSGADLVHCDRTELEMKTGSQRLVATAPFDVFKLIACATLMRAELLRRVGGWRPLFWEEYDLYIRYLKASGKPPRHVAESLYTYRRHSSNMTGDPGKVAAGWKEFFALWPRESLTPYGAPPA